MSYKVDAEALDYASPIPYHPGVEAPIVVTLHHYYMDRSSTKPASMGSSLGVASCLADNRPTLAKIHRVGMPIHARNAPPYTVESGSSCLFSLYDRLGFKGSGLDVELKCAPLL